MKKPATPSDLLAVTETHAVHIERPGLVDAFGAPNGQFGFVIRLCPIEYQIVNEWVGQGTTLEEAIANLVQTPKV